MGNVKPRETLAEVKETGCYDHLVVKKRRSLTPSTGVPLVGGVHAMRRAGARREVSTRVYLHGRDAQVLEGWALNVSKGGVRVILEDPVELGMEFDVTLGGADTEADDGVQRGRIVWVQEEPDGVIAGIEFTGASGTHKSAPPPPVDKD
jgi:hypothetical protein